MAARLKERYREEIIPALRERFGYGNDLEVPRLEKIVVNMGVGEGAHDPKAIDAAMKDMGIITGQKPKLNRAKKSVAGFKLRADQRHVRGAPGGRKRQRSAGRGGR